MDLTVAVFQRINCFSVTPVCEYTRTPRDTPVCGVHLAQNVDSSFVKPLPLEVTYLGPTRRVAIRDARFFGRRNLIIASPTMSAAQKASQVRRSSG